MYLQAETTKSLPLAGPGELVQFLTYYDYRWVGLGRVGLCSRHHVAVELAIKCKCRGAMKFKFSGCFILKMTDLSTLRGSGKTSLPKWLPIARQPDQ